MYNLSDHLPRVKASSCAISTPMDLITSVVLAGFHLQHLEFLQCRYQDPCSCLDSFYGQWKKQMLFLSTASKHNEKKKVFILKLGG